MTERAPGGRLRLAFVASASIHATRWMGYFAQRGHVVRWFATETPARAIPGVDCTVLPAASMRVKAAGVAASLAPLRRGLAAFAPDVVHAHYAGVPGVLAGLGGRRPLVITAWGSDVLFAAPRPVAGLPIRQALRRADLVTCDAQHMIEAIAALGVARGRLARINFGTDVERFQPQRRDAALDARLRLGAGPRVISIRNFHPVYDLQTLVRSIPAVLGEVPETTFVIGGTGPDEAALRRLAAALGVADRVRFCGAVPNDQLPAYFAAADVYVSTSLSDAGLSASTQEAMACSLPAVVTRAGENHLWIEDGVNGCLIEPRDHEGLARRLVELLRNSSLRTRLAQRARDVIAERSNHQIEMLRMESLYFDLTRKEAARVVSRTVRQPA